MKMQAYQKVLGDLKLIMKKRMLEDRMHKSQHEDMSEEKYDKKGKMDYGDDEYDDHDDYENEKMSFMKGRSNSDYKNENSSPEKSPLMIMLTGKPKKKSKRKTKKAY